MLVFIKRYVTYGIISCLIWLSYGKASKFPGNFEFKNEKKFIFNNKKIDQKAKEIALCVCENFPKYLQGKPVNCIVATHDKITNKDYIFAGSRSGKIYCYCIQDDSFSPYITLKKVGSIVEMSCVKNLLVLGSCDAELKMYDIEKKEERSFLMSFNDRCMKVSLSDDQKFVASAGERGFWYMWDVMGSNKEPLFKRSFGCFNKKRGPCPIFYEKYCFYCCDGNVVRLSLNDNFSFILKSFVGEMYGDFKRIMILRDSIAEKEYVGILTSLENFIVCDIQSLKMHKVISLEQKQTDTLLLSVQTCMRNQKTYIIGSYSDGTVCVWDPVLGSFGGLYKVSQNAIKSMTIINDTLYCLTGQNELVKVSINDFFVNEQKDFIIY